MRIQTPKRSSSGFFMGLFVLGLGVAIGLWLPSFWKTESMPDAVPLHPVRVDLQVPVARNPTPEAAPENELETLVIELTIEAASRLQLVRDRAMEVGQIIQQDGDLVPAMIRADGRDVRARVRIKGDLRDHIDTPKWSLRIELRDDKLFGMSRFSIQHPKTRAFLWEWLIMQLGRRAGLLTPRSEFVNVVINGNAMGIYYLEEHFTKELVESQGRRDGPIMRFVEDAALGTRSQFHHPLGYIPDTLTPASDIGSAPIAAYGEKRLAQSEALTRQLQQGIELMRVIRKDADGEQTQRVLDVPTSAVYAALQVLFRTHHGSLWKSRRYYYNPSTSRLEPILFDTGAGNPDFSRDPAAIMRFALASYLKNPVFYRAFYRELGRVMQPGYLDAAWEALGPELRRLEGLLRAEGLESPLLDAAAIFAELREQQAFLQRVTHPDATVAFECRLLTDDPDASRSKGELQVEMWALTRVPVIFEGLVLDSGRFVEASSLHCDVPLLPAFDDVEARMLPIDNSHVVFTVRSTEREAILKDIDQLKKALATGETWDKSHKGAVSARTRLAHDTTSVETELQIRKFGKEWIGEGGRPEPPTPAQALERHPFLRFDDAARRVAIQPGVHDVRGDLVIPEGWTLFAGAGVELRFQPGRALISSGALQFEGLALEPVRLGPQDARLGWGGVVVLEAENLSVWRHVEVQRARNVERGGWMSTGGISFYRSAVSLVDCRIQDALGEDALNIFGSQFTLRRVVIDGCASDAFDGDFVTGEVESSQFLHTTEDAVDVSGSVITVRDCTFREIGDKAVSAGEHSTVSMRACTVKSASIAVAAKDSSRVDIDGLAVESVSNYAFAAYIKKQEFGPSSIQAVGVTLGVLGLGEGLAQETCSIVIDGRSLPTQVLDVKSLYRQKILGQ